MLAFSCGDDDPSDIDSGTDTDTDGDTDSDTDSDTDTDTDPDAGTDGGLDSGLTDGGVGAECIGAGFGCHGATWCSNHDAGIQAAYTCPGSQVCC